MAQRFTTQKLGDYADSLRKHAAYVRDVQNRLGRPGFRQLEIDDAEREFKALQGWMKASGKRRTNSVPHGRPWVGAPLIKQDWAPETRHERDCEYVVSSGPAPCTCKAGQHQERPQIPHLNGEVL